MSVTVDYPILDPITLEPSNSGIKYERQTFDDGRVILAAMDGNPTVDPVVLAKENKLLELQRSYYASFTTFQSNTTGTVKTYPIDSEAQDNLRDLQNRLIADSNKNSFYFKTIEDRTLINHTRAQFLQLMQDAETFKVNQTQHYDSKVAAVNSATDIPTVQGIAW